MATNRGRAYKRVAHKNIFIYKNSKKSKSQIVWKTTRKIEKYNKITKCQKSKSLAAAWCYAACMAICMAMGLSLVAWSHLALARGCAWGFRLAKGSLKSAACTVVWCMHINVCCACAPVVSVPSIGGRPGLHSFRRLYEHCAKCPLIVVCMARAMLLSIF